VTELADTSWVAEERAGCAIGFGSDGSVHESSGINRFAGTYVPVDGRLVMGPLAGTRMAGPDDAMGAEMAFLALLEASPRFAVADGVLVLGEGDAEIRFLPA
jgi:heat shock protein HslJ